MSALLLMDIKVAKSLPHADYIIHAAASSNEKKYQKNIQKEINNNKEIVN